MRELNVCEVGAVAGGETHGGTTNPGLFTGSAWGAIGLTGGDSGYAPTAQAYGRGAAFVVGLTFGLPGAIAAVGAFSVGWAIGSVYNYFSDTSGSGGSTSSSNSSCSSSDSGSCKP